MEVGGRPDSAGLDLLHGCARQRAQQAAEQQGRSAGPPVIGVSVSGSACTGSLRLETRTDRWRCREVEVEVEVS